MGLFKRHREAGSAGAGLYVSEFEQFLNRMKEDHPEIDRNQVLGRALLWDKLPRLPDSPDSAGQEGKLRQPSYVYYNDID
ncbi:DUF3460 family protein [Caballeronia sp. Lep1P3]|uniref:DUF3460 family protein n=1 Tax=Caballeronia sp. Lep1P3 TaxID=2878150 RepID=UPI001FD11FD7|nr:DUF3460 family protein [Caballeronia sp. Lep1P3]